MKLKSSYNQPNYVLNFLFWDKEEGETLQAIESMCSHLEQQLTRLPVGNIRVSGKGRKKEFHHIYYDNSGNCIDRYISKRKEKQLIKELSQKRYMVALKKEILREYHLLKRIGHVENPEAKYQVYDNMSDCLKEYITPFYPSSQYIDRLWQNQKWITNDGYPSDKIYKTNRGEMVRSKSEKIIADLLYSDKNLDYVYEAALFLPSSKRCIYPDFIILNKTNGRIYIWEHAGMIGDMDYSTDFIRKYNNYDASGIKVGVNLFFTMENSAVSYDVDRGISIYNKIRA